MNDDIINELYLPLSNPNEDLETISNNNFKPLLDAIKFEIRSEDKRDKGIDFHIEIKGTNKSGATVYTNFRFAVQLKATENIKPNKDGSISLQLNTSNINYLLRNPMPAYYILYFKETNTFYFESINDFVAILYEKDINWNNQQTHIIRFNKTLDKIAINGIYNATMHKGKFQRIINEKTILRSMSANPKDKILFDKDFNVSADSEIRTIIEAIGLDLVNEAKWSDILAVHKTASGTVASTAMYNLVLGIANYHSGKWMEALSFFRRAKNLKSELSQELIDHMRFFESKIKLSIGMLTTKQFQEIMNELERAEYLGLYIRLEQAKKTFTEQMDVPGQREKLLAEMASISNHPNADESIQLNVKSELLLLEGFRINMEYIQRVCRINAFEIELGPNSELRKNSILKFIADNAQWSIEIKELKEKAKLYRNEIVYYNTVLIEAKIRYQFLAQAASVKIVIEIPGAPELDMPDNAEMCESLLSMASQGFDYFNRIEHIENCIAALSLIYEILHFMGRFDDASKCLATIEKLVELYDLADQRSKVEYLKNGGTTHEQFKSFIDDSTESIENSRKAHDRYVQQRAEMEEMDKEEEKNKGDKPKEGYLHLHLFPIGYFQFPSTSKDKVYEILNVADNAIQQLDEVFELVVPVVNILYDKVEEEGYREGNAAARGSKSWDNIYRIRKAFYENKFYRFEIRM
jgi:hypothetical protein